LELVVVVIFAFVEWISLWALLFTRRVLFLQQLIFWFFLFMVSDECGKCLRRGEGRKRECTGAKCGSLGGRMLAASLDFYKDSSALEADER